MQDILNKYRDVLIEDLNSVINDYVDYKVKRDLDFNYDPEIIEKAKGVWIMGWNKSPDWLNYCIKLNVFYESPKLKNTLTILKAFEIDPDFVLQSVAYVLLKPGAKLPIHLDEKYNNDDDSKERVFHYGLIIPPGNHNQTINRVIEEQEKKLFSFNDGNLHSAENTSEKDRYF
eukprot:Pgem_evm4s18256